MWLQSRSIGASGKRPRLTTSEFSSVSIVAPIARAASTKAMSPWIDSSPTPSMRSPAPLRGNRPGGDEVRRRRGVALDGKAAGRAQRVRAEQAKALPAIAFDRHAEALEQPERDLDVRLGDQLARDLDHCAARAGAQRQGEQQGGEELARDVAANDDRPRRARAGPAPPARAAAEIPPRRGSRSRSLARAARRRGRRSAARASAACRETRTALPARRRRRGRRRAAASPFRRCRARASSAGRAGGRRCR